jgi:hypothetical protein
MDVALISYTPVALSAIDCPGGFCHSHDGGYHINRQYVEIILSDHSETWCETVAARMYKIAVDSISQLVIPTLR